MLIVSLPFDKSSIRNIFFVTLFSSLSSLTELLLSKRNLWIIILVFDVITASAVIVISGGVDSALYMLYFLVILVYTMKKGAKAGWASLATTMFVFFFVLLFQRLGYYYFADDKIEFFRKTFQKNTQTFSYLTQYLYALFSSTIITAMSIWMEQKTAVKTRQLEYVRHTTDDILRSLKEGLLSVTSSYETVFVNPSFILFSGMSMLIPGKIIPQKARSWFEENISSIELVGIDGRKRSLKIDINEIVDQKDNVIGRIMVIHDITDVIEKDKKLNEINQMALMGEMSANIAHEIRNPLASIRVSIDLLTKNLDEKGGEVALIAKNEVDRINNLIEHFMSFSKMPTPKVKPIKLGEVVKETVKSFSITGDNAEINIDQFEDDIIVNADKNQLKQVMLNLLSNSCKAVRDSKEKKVFIKTRRYGEKIFLSVKDTGVGIKSGSLSKVFNPFFTESGQGNGLGLSIVKKIASMHGWDIRVESEEGKGTEFFIVLENFQKREN
ncbi:GHKL domain-containing protein [candidate division WOR-3 bacterium]|nr:GHKL domain-containing protein [candidate division WOR-3 bacterium]